MLWLDEGNAAAMVKALEQFVGVVRAGRSVGNTKKNVSATIEDIISFWDAHSTADYEDQMEDVPLEFDIQEEVYTVALVPDLADLLANKARAKGVNTEILVNLWLAEKLTVAA